SRARFAAVHRVKWSTDRKTLRIIFLGGDAPPHMDYKDDVKYPDTCKKACEKDIIINTIQCGTDPECTKYWKDIARKAEGSFVAIPQDGGVRVVSTPYDKDLAKLNKELTQTCLVWGTAAQREAHMAKDAEARGLRSYEAASRVAFQAKNSQLNAYDLLDNIRQGKVKLEDVKEDQLPEQLKKLKTTKERKEYLAKLDEKRKDL